MRVLICGSRTWNDVDIIVKALQKMPAGTVIIHGDAAGADTIADVVAEAIGFERKKFPISDDDWEKFGKSAGFRRNRQMLFEGEPDLILAFIDTLSDSFGTQNMIELGESYGKQVVKIEKPCWPESCPTCGESYTDPPTSRALICSSAFHCCRACTWQEGVVTVRCGRHSKDPSTP